MFSVVKDEANLIHEREVNGAVCAGGGGRTPLHVFTSVCSLLVSQFKD